MLDEPLTSDNLPDLSKMTMTNLEPGTAYRFRLAAINSCGVGEFGEVSELISLCRFISKIYNKFLLTNSRHRLKLVCLVFLVLHQQLKSLNHPKVLICHGNRHQVHKAKS